MASKTIVERTVNGWRFRAPGARGSVRPAALIARGWPAPRFHRELSRRRPAMRFITAMCALLVIVPRVCMSDELFRCGSWLVSADMSVAELVKKCGKASSQQVSTQDVWNSYGVKVGTSTTAIWRYDRGPRAAAMVVTIVDGKIESIRREATAN
jgi:hypothetical protein